MEYLNRHYDPDAAEQKIAMSTLYEEMPIDTFRFIFASGFQDTIYRNEAGEFLVGNITSDRFGMSIIGFPLPSDDAVVVRKLSPQLERQTLEKIAEMYEF